MKNTEAEQQYPIHLFKCGACKDAEEMEFKSFKEHLLNVHNLSGDGLKGKKQTTMHLDMKDTYSSNYHWTLDNGLEFDEFYEGLRDKKSLIR